MPLIGVAQHQIAQRVAVMVNQLARHHQPAPVAGAIEVGIARPQQLRQFARETAGGLIGKLIRADKGDARFGGIGEDHAQIRITGQRHKFAELLPGLDFTVEAADQPGFADLLALIVQPADQRGIETILLIQAVADFTVARPHHHDPGIGALMFIQPVDLPVNKGAQEVAFAELDHPVAIDGARKVVTV